MCGIFAYKGPQKNAAHIVINGLKKLEYRGYDSWGIAFKNRNNEIEIHKEIGKMLDISDGTSKSHLARARKKIQQLLFEKAEDKKKNKKTKITKK